MDQGNLIASLSHHTLSHLKQTLVSEGLAIGRTNRIEDSRTHLPALALASLYFRAAMSIMQQGDLFSFSGRNTGCPVEKAHVGV